MIDRIQTAYRYVLLAAIASIFTASIALLLHETIVVFIMITESVINMGKSQKAVKLLATGIIEAIDVILIAIVAYITSVGAYALLIDETVKLPRWLKISGISDLKEQLIGAIVIVMSVLFLQQAVAQSEGTQLLQLGAGIGAMVCALALFLKIRGKPEDG